MALVDNNPLFDIKGKLGRYVIREFNGKRVVSLRPLQYKKTKSKEALKLQSNFAAIISFARHVNSIHDLASLWKNSSVKGFSAYHKIIKSNLKLADSGILTAQNIIVPNSLPSLITDIHLDKNELKVTINNLSAINTITGKHTLKLIIVFTYFNSKENLQSKIYISSMQHHLQIDDCEGDIQHCISIPSEQLRMGKRFRHLILYSTLIWESTAGHKLEWCSTYSKIIE